MSASFTRRQGRYRAYIHIYTQRQGRPPKQRWRVIDAAVEVLDSTPIWPEDAVAGACAMSEVGGPVPAPSLRLCERVRQAVENYAWETIAPGLRVTLSLGLATWTEPAHPETLLAQADTHLYHSGMARCPWYPDRAPDRGHGKGVQRRDNNW